MSLAGGRSFRSWPRGLERSPECQRHALPSGRAHRIARTIVPPGRAHRIARTIVPRSPA